MRLILAVLVSGFVSILGLTSCSQDTATEDSWRLRAPHIVDPATPAMNLTEAPTSRPSVAAELVFEDGDLDGVSLDVLSTCRAGTLQANEHVSLHSTSHVPLGSLWPKSFWRTLSADQLEESVCALQFVATNSRGSTHSFRIPALRLKGWGTFDAKAAKRAPGEAWSLLCDGFTVETSDAVATPANSLTPLALQMAPSKPIYGHRACRLLSSKKEEASGLSRFALSSPFELSIPNPRADFSFTTSYEVFGTARGSEPFVTARFTNPHDVEIAVRVQLPTSMTMQPLFSLAWKTISHPEDQWYATNPYNEDLAVKLSGEGNHWSQDGFETLLIAPHSTVTIALSFQAPMKCVRGIPENFGDSSGALSRPETYGNAAELSGFFFAFDRPLVIQSIDYWRHDHPYEESSTYTAYPATLPVSRVQPRLEAFQGLAPYLHDVDSTGAPPTQIKFATDNPTRWCQFR